MKNKTLISDLKNFKFPITETLRSFLYSYIFNTYFSWQ